MNEKILFVALTEGGGKATLSDFVLPEAQKKKAVTHDFLCRAADAGVHGTDSRALPAPLLLLWISPGGF